MARHQRSIGLGAPSIARNGGQLSVNGSGIYLDARQLHADNTLLQTTPNVWDDDTPPLTRTLRAQESGISYTEADWFCS